MKYRLLMNGNCFEGSAHILSDSEVNEILEFQKVNDIESLSEMFEDLSIILGESNYAPDRLTNYWLNYTSIRDAELNFTLIDGHEKVLWRSTEIYDLEQTKWVDLVSIEDLDIPSLSSYNAAGKAELDAYPQDSKSNILFYFQESKGTLLSFTIESETKPMPSDFALISRALETPKYEFELIDKIFYKGNLLQRQYDYEEYRIDHMTIELFTLKDVE
jgi:hypothetical protein